MARRKFRHRKHDIVTFKMGCRCRECVHADRMADVRLNQSLRRYRQWKRGKARARSRLALTAAVTIAVVKIIHRLPALRELMGISPRE
jgi:hypothetical protein